MKKLLLSGALACAAMTVSAQVSPKVMPETPVDGGKYMLVNKVTRADQYLSRTSWDGAIYYRDKDGSNYQNYFLTAYANENGSWSFAFINSTEKETGEIDGEGKPITETVDEQQWLILPQGSPNLNANDSIKAEWKLEAKDNGFFNLIASEGNNSAILAWGPDTENGTITRDVRLHLNNNKDFAVAMYFGGPFFPDCFGGISEDYNDETGYSTWAANDSITFNWGFVSPEKLDAYYADMQYVSTLNSYYNTYCDLDEYGEGFKASFDAALAIYNSSDDAETLAGMFDILNAKEALYKAIEKAIATNEADNAVLNKAIETAMTAFSTLTAAADVEAATAAIIN